ncbi:MAG: hypothetical protein ACE5GK_02755 [Nitrospiria bacterium]
MDLFAHDLKGVLKIIDLVSTCANKQALMQTVFREVDKLIGISSGVYLPIDPKTQNFQFPGPIAYHIPSDSAIPWVNYYNRIDPIITGWQGEVNKVMQNSEVLPAPRLAASEFNLDFLATFPIFYVMGAFCGRRGTRWPPSAFIAKKTTGPFRRVKNNSPISSFPTSPTPCTASNSTKPFRPFKASA